MNPLYLSWVAPEVVCYDNDNSALIPELWAREGLALLTETTVATRLVNRQFENEVSKFGDMVHTRRPNRRQGRRRSGASSDTYVVGDANLTDVQVKLDQWFYDSFVIDDLEASESMQSLVQTHLLPAMQNLGRQADRAILGRIHEFVGQGPAKRARPRPTVEFECARLLARRPRDDEQQLVPLGRAHVVPRAVRRNALLEDRPVRRGQPAR